MELVTAEQNRETRIQAIRPVLTAVLEAFGLDIGFELWDGSTVPADYPPDGLRLVIRQEGAITRLLRRPGASTLIDLHAAGFIDIAGGTLFDLAARRPKVRSREARRRLDKGLIVRAALRFLFGTAPLPPFPSFTGAGRRSGSRQTDIAFHYDVSNDFYRLFLDPEMVYTCAYFRDWSNDLATAQHDKLDMICRKLRLKPGDRLLDIGSGWGALICHAAEHYGVTALGVTLSNEQLELTRRRIAERGLGDRVRVELQDYRTLDGQFDKISSIGMFEHVGFDHHDDYFATIRRLLVDRGLYLHHAITRPGKSDVKTFRRKRTEYQAIIRYIFPGAELDHIGWTATKLEANGFEVHDVEGWREHYARTTELWARNLIAQRAEAEALVGPEKTRLWILYLAGVSLGFASGSINIFQTLASKRRRGPSGLPPTREHLYA